MRAWWSFGLGALAVTLAQGVVLLLIGRLGQGIGAACLVGTSLAVLSAATPEKHRAFVLGLWGAMIALGMGLGPIIAGLLTEYLSWRIIFVSDLVLLVVPLGGDRALRDAGRLCAEHAPIRA